MGAAVARTCEYDTGSMYGCLPACDKPSSVRLTYKSPCYPVASLELCSRHVDPMRARLYPYRIVAVEPVSS